MTFDEKSDPAPVVDYAAAMPVQVQGTPEQLPVTVEQLPRPVKPQPAPNKMVATERVLNAKGEIVGLDILPLAGNALVRVELRDLLSKRWKVQLFTEPRRGRTPRSSKPKSRKGN